VVKQFALGPQLSLSVSQTRGMGHLKPVVFVLGPSGVGKSYLSKMLKNNNFLYVHIDTDSREKTFKENGFPSEWDKDFLKINLGQLVAVLQDRLSDKYIGGVISFPTTYVFTSEMLAEAKRLGVIPILLWSTKENCIRAATIRINKKGKQFDLARYQLKNERAFLIYGRSEYEAFRVEAFQEDGSRYPDQEWLAIINKRISG